MTTWSAVDPTVGHLKVGLNVTTSDSTPSYGESITITVNYYVETVNWTYSDRVTLNWQAFGTSGSTTIDLELGSNQSAKYLTKTHTYTAGSSAINDVILPPAPASLIASVSPDCTSGARIAEPRVLAPRHRRSRREWRGPRPQSA